jgi:hypothetical protein
VRVTTRLGREGLAEHARLGFGDLDLEVTPLAFSPVLLTHPDGRLDRFLRAHWPGSAPPMDDGRSRLD